MWAGSSSETGAATGDNTGTGTKYMKNARDRSYLAVAIARLAALGVPVNNEASFGNAENAAGLDPAPVASNGCDADYDMNCLYDPRIRRGSAGVNPGLNMLLSGAVQTFGGHAWNFQSGVTTNHFIDPTIPITNVRAYVRQAASATAGSKLWISDAGASESAPLTFLAGASDSGIHTLDLTGIPLGIKRPKIRGASANPSPSYLIGMEFWDAARTELRFIMAGARGWSSIDWATGSSPSAPINMLAAVACDIVIDTLGGNEEFSAADSLIASGDAITTPNAASYIGRLNRWYNAVVAAGGRPVKLLKPFGVAAGGQVDGGPYTETQIRDKTIELCGARGIPYFDLSGPAGTYAAAQAAGEVAPDGTHYFKPWHDRVGKAVGDWLYRTGLRGLV